MAIDLTGLDYSFGGQPFVQVVPSNADLTTLDYTFGGVPFYAPTTVSSYSDSITETGALTDSFPAIVAFADIQTNPLTATDSFGSNSNFRDYISEVGVLSDSQFGSVVTSGEVIAHDVIGIDYAFNGQPFIQTGISGTWTLDYAFQGQPFVIVEQSQVGKIQPMLAIVSWPQMNV